MMKKAKMLVIDFDELFVDSICLLLESYGLTAKGEVTVENALANYESYKPDIVLFEIFNYGENNCEDIKKLKQKADIPIIVITSYENLITETLIETYGIADYIIKPFTIDELLGVTRKHLGLI